MKDNAKPAVSDTVRADVLPPCSGPCIDCGTHVQILACYQVVQWTGGRKPIVHRPLCGDCYRKRQNAPSHAAAIAGRVDSDVGEQS